MNIRQSQVMATVAATLLLATAARAAEQADLILYNGKVLTVDPSFSIRQAVVVKDGKILAVGGNDLAKAYSAPRRVDLKGRTVMPGFMDTHLHIRDKSHRDIDPASAKSIAEIQEQLRGKAKELGPGEWITGFGWDEALLK